MSKRHINENYIHDCGEEKVALSSCVKSINELGFSNEEMAEIIDFYLLHAPIQDGNKNDPFGLRSLKDYGWAGNSDMSRLEGRLLKAANMSMFCHIRADRIAQTLEAMNLTDEICYCHSRAVIKQNFKVEVLESGEVSISPKETRMQSVFRHIRNSIAHNHIYGFDNEYIMIEDCDENGSVTARILMPKKALIEWIRIVKEKTNVVNNE